jgi:photosystem II stability/assembly factor-like uncharacterized protein
MITLNKNLFRLSLLIIISSYFPLETTAQKKTKANTQTSTLPECTPASARLAAYKVKNSTKGKSITNQVPFTNIGPTIMSGRVVDMDVNQEDPNQFYIAYASGGLFVSRNNGQSFTPIFDNEAILTIGDIAVDWKNGETIWVGTGESNSSRSSYSGNGIYKSTDKGVSWQHLGLEESHHIGKIVLHPTDPNIAWVAAVGHLYSPNHQRGIYKTSDGGKNWKQVLYINPYTGGIDIEIDPGNPNILYAAMWERERQAWNFKGSGGGSGIYKSLDGGDSWQLSSKPGNGFPTGEHVGRIGLAVYPKNPNIVYAFLDNQGFRLDDKEKDTSILTKNDLRKMTLDTFLNLDYRKIDKYLTDNNFPENYKAKDIIQKVKDGQLKPIDLVYYLEEANAQLFDTPIIGAELYRSDDGGVTWYKTHTEHLEGLYYTYGYYFGKMTVSPQDPDVVYLYGVDIVTSKDGGKSFKSILKENVHVDFHGLWINPLKTDHLLAATDGGLNMSYDDGDTWSKLNAPAVSQFYFINTDNAKPYNVYGGMQDNGTWYGPSNFKANNAWHASGQNPYKELGGGDGMQVAIDTTQQLVFYGYQFGHYFRKDMKSGKVEYITPKHELGERPFRWNWQTPLIISKHNPAIAYMGSNHFHRSMDRGVTFPLRSKDLTNGGKKGNVPYGTLTSIDESPLRFGLIYCGSDDGLVHVSKDAGQNWENISTGLPKDLWVSRVVASAHVEGTVYVTLNGYRYDHFNPYIFESKDYGKTWLNISSNLPLEPVNVIVEDPQNADILYVGTDNGLYISFDRGKSYSLFTESLPPVAVHDLKIQKREKDLLVGTHGRSIYKVNLSEIQQINEKIRNEPVYIFAVNKINYNPSWGRKRQVWSESPEAKLLIPIWSISAQLGTIDIYADELKLTTLEPVELTKGLQYVEYNLSIDSLLVESYQEWLNSKLEKDKDPIVVKKGDIGVYYLRPGKYRIKITNSTGESYQAEFEVSEGRMGFRYGVRPSEREERKIKEFHWDEE